MKTPRDASGSQETQRDARDKTRRTQRPRNIRKRQKSSGDSKRHQETRKDAKTSEQIRNHELMVTTVEHQGCHKTLEDDRVPAGDAWQHHEAPDDRKGSQETPKDAQTSQCRRRQSLHYQEHISVEDARVYINTKHYCRGRKLLH